MTTPASNDRAQRTNASGQTSERAPAVSRRKALAAGVAAGGLFALPAAAMDQPKTKPAAAKPTTRPAAKPAVELVPLNRFPHLVHEYFVRRVRQSEAEAVQLREAMTTRADAEQYVVHVRKAIAECFGPLPEKTPLNARITGKVERDAYTIEKLLFESRPGFLVSANLYIPKGRPFPLPAVVGTCGHSTNGKAAEAYQSFAQGLARQGYVVLIYDPLGQGERTQYLDMNTRPGHAGSVAEHLRCGNQQFLVGEFLGTWRAWDGIRALDYLLSRKEVDPKHVGVTGNSGGGTMTTWLCGVERRWTMAAPSCFVTTFRRNMENELPADTEQCPPGALLHRLDHADFLAAMAPKPVIILAQEKDFFDVRGSAEAFARLKRLYALLGAEENIALFVGPTYHGYTQENREAMYRWFNRCTKISTATTEPAITLEKDETLWATPAGRVAEVGSKSVFSFTRAASQRLAAARKPPEGKELAAAVREALALPQQVPLPDYRILRSVGSRRYPQRHNTCYAVETEPGILALVVRLSAEPGGSRPQAAGRAAVLYIAHQSADDELRSEALTAELLAAEPEADFYACDVRGIGETRPDTCGQNQFRLPYGSDYFYAIHSLMLGTPYLGQKTADVLGVLAWLTAAGHKQVHLAGKGWGALPATFAALLSPAVGKVTLKNALSSYAAVAESEQYAWPLSSFLHGVLRRFDLPDCYRALGKRLRQIDPWGPAAEGEKLS